MQKMVFGVASLLLTLAGSAVAADLTIPGLGTVGVVGGVGAVGGATLSGSNSVSRVEGYKSPRLEGTVLARSEGFGLGESSVRGDFNTGYAGGTNGAALSLNTRSGSLSETGASLTGTGNANSSASNLSGAATISVGGGVGLGVR